MAPIDILPDLKGNIVPDLKAGTYRVVMGEERERLVSQGVSLHLNHWATCPVAQAERERKRRRALRDSKSRKPTR